MARLLGGLFARLHQPPVIGELIAGILLGPTGIELPCRMVRHVLPISAT